MPKARAIAAWSANCSRVPTTLPWVTVWSCTSICQAPLLATTIRTGALWRTAVSTSMALKPNAPSPVATTTGRSGKARLAAIP